jgi:hypothetical protein
LGVALLLLEKDDNHPVSWGSYQNVYTFWCLWRVVPVPVICHLWYWVL